jgi:quercetin dioxygenase-like cupin family protein
MPASPTGRRSFLTILGASLSASFGFRRQNAREFSGPFPFGRRYVTGVDASGKSRIVNDQPVPASAAWRRPGPEGVREGYDYWVIRQLPAPLDETSDPLATWAAPGGLEAAVGRFITWQPGFESPIHSTPTLDFVLVIAGGLELRLQTETRVLRPGDGVIQRGTKHSWRVPGPEPCTIAAILFDAHKQA